MATYHAKYELNHARKGPYFPRMPDMILKRTVRGMLPYQKVQRPPCPPQPACGNRLPVHLDGDLPDGHAAGDRSAPERPLPDRYMSLGDISAGLGATALGR